MLFNLYSRQRILECRETFRAEQIHHENQLIHKQHYDLIHRNEALLSQSQHDALTGLPNRACLNDFAETTLTRALKNNCTIGVEILDIDYFKNINDRTTCLYSLGSIDPRSASHAFQSTSSIGRLSFLFIDFFAIIRILRVIFVSFPTAKINYPPIISVDNLQIK